MAERFGKGYDNADDAAAAALMALNFQPRVADQEYMGLIYQDPSDGKFYRTNFQTQGQRGASEWRGSLEGKAAGLVHNHPMHSERSAYKSTDFSPADVGTAQSMKVPSFIRSSDVNTERRYVPAHGRPLVQSDTGV